MSQDVLCGGMNLRELARFQNSHAWPQIDYLILISCQSKPIRFIVDEIRIDFSLAAFHFTPSLFIPCIECCLRYSNATAEPRKRLNRHCAVK